jgi:hypothetical protein
MTNEAVRLDSEEAVSESRRTAALDPLASGTHAANEASQNRVKRGTPECLHAILAAYKAMDYGASRPPARCVSKGNRY